MAYTFEMGAILNVYEYDFLKPLFLRFEHLPHRIFVPRGSDNLFEYLPLEQGNDICTPKYMNCQARTAITICSLSCHKTKINVFRS